MKRWFFGISGLLPLCLAAMFGGGATMSAAGAHDYFNMLTGLQSHWKSWSLRDAAQLGRPLDGGFANSNDKALGLWVTYDPAHDSDVHKQDAAKVIIPAFTVESAGKSSLGASLDPASTSVVLSAASNTNLVSLIPKNAALKIDEEMMLITAFDGPTSTATVVRGSFGTRGVAHGAGALVQRSNNSLPNQVRLPLDTQDGHSYLFTWDGYWTDSYIGSGLGSHKTFQLSSGGDSIWLETRTRFDGGTTAFEIPGRFEKGVDAAAVDLRTYNQAGGGLLWSLLDMNKYGPKVTRDQPLEPRTASRTFVIKPNRWTRFWMRVDQRPNDYDLVEFWVADEQVNAVKLYDRLQLSVRQDKKTQEFEIDKFWLEFNASDDKFVRGDQRPLVAYVRNFVALRDVNDVDSLLQRPNDVSVNFLAAPRNVRIVR